MRVLVPVLARILSALLALTLVAAGVVLVVEVVSAWVGHGWLVLPSDTRARFAEWRWDDRSVVLTIVGIGVVGVLSFLTGLWRRPPLTVPVGDANVAIERHSLELSLSRRLRALDGVIRARVRIDPTRLRARVDTNQRRAVDEVRAAAQQLLEDVVSANHLTLEPSVDVHAPPRAQLTASDASSLSAASAPTHAVPS